MKKFLRDKKPLANPNPEKTFCRRYHYKDLDGNNYEDIVDKFAERIKYWFIKPCKELIRKNISSNNFLIMLTVCPLIDLLTQYYYGSPASDNNEYKEFLRKFMPAFQSKIKPSLLYYQWNSQSRHWQEKPVVDYAEAFYYMFRCALLHNAMIGVDGRISGKSILKKTIKIRKWHFGNKKGREIAVNAELLLKNVERFFNGYIKGLRDKREKELRECFIRKFQWDFGIEVKML